MLTDTQARRAKPREKPYRLPDSGGLIGMELVSYCVRYLEGFDIQTGMMIHRIDISREELPVPHQAQQNAWRESGLSARDVPIILNHLREARRIPDIAISLDALEHGGGANFIWMTDAETGELWPS